MSSRSPLIGAIIFALLYYLAYVVGYYATIGYWDGIEFGIRPAIAALGVALSASVLVRAGFMPKSKLGDLANDSEAILIALTLALLFSFAEAAKPLMQAFGLSFQHFR